MRHSLTLSTDSFDYDASLPSQVGSEGVDHIAALKSLISLQKIPYDFGFYKMDFEVDHPTIALSHGGSLVQAGAAVPVVAAGEACASSHETALPRLRVYVEATRRMDLALDEVSSAFAEEDFVKSRQQGHALTVRMYTSLARLVLFLAGRGSGTGNALMFTFAKSAVLYFYESEWRRGLKL